MYRLSAQGLFLIAEWLYQQSAIGLSADSTGRILVLANATLVNPIDDNVSREQIWRIEGTVVDRESEIKEGDAEVLVILMDSNGNQFTPGLVPATPR